MIDDSPLEERRTGWLYGFLFDDMGNDGQHQTKSVQDSHPAHALEVYPQNQPDPAQRIMQL